MWREGHTPAITCAYHAWTYALDGRLRGAPRTECLKDFDKSKHGLKPVRVEIFASFVFVNLDSRRAVGGADGPRAPKRRLRQHLPDLDRLTLIEQVDVAVPANWKVIQEKLHRGLSLRLFRAPVHKQLVQLIDFEGYKLEEHDKYWTYIGPAPQGRQPRLWAATRQCALAD